MGRKALAIAGLVLALAAGTWPQQRLQVAITSPADGGRVDTQTTVTGTVSDTNAVVWVIVHPRGNPRFWVQPEASLHAHGRWDCEAYFGEPGAQRGLRFDIMAVANPVRQLEVEMQLQSWPQAAARSRVVTVTKR